MIVLILAGDLNVVGKMYIRALIFRSLFSIKCSLFFLFSCRFFFLSYLRRILVRVLVSLFDFPLIASPKSTWRSMMLIRGRGRWRIDTCPGGDEGALLLPPPSYFFFLSPSSLPSISASIFVLVLFSLRFFFRFSISLILLDSDCFPPRSAPPTFFLVGIIFSDSSRRISHLLPLLIHFLILPFPSTSLCSPLSIGPSAYFSRYSLVCISSIFLFHTHRFFPPFSLSHLTTYSLTSRLPAYLPSYLLPTCTLI